MTTALETLSAVIRQKRLALKAEQIYCCWLKRFCNYLRILLPHLPSELELELFLTVLDQNHVSASTKNQVFCGAGLVSQLLLARWS